MRASDIGCATLPGNRYGKLNQDHAVRALSLSLSLSLSSLAAALGGALFLFGERRVAGAVDVCLPLNTAAV